MCSITDPHLCSDEEGDDDATLDVQTEQDEEAAHGRTMQIDKTNLLASTHDAADLLETEGEHEGTSGVGIISPDGQSVGKPQSDASLELMDSRLGTNPSAVAEVALRTFTGSSTAVIGGQAGGGGRGDSFGAQHVAGGAGVQSTESGQSAVADGTNVKAKREYIVCDHLLCSCGATGCGRDLELEQVMLT